ncbi:MAG TPA: hypothetical protein VEB86_12565, partial [Chryseosolibacter sp.]|nr:hypothetical protein [Chryseosolibacter sp.]
MKRLIFIPVIMLCGAIVGAQVPGTLSYQGILVTQTGVPVADGNHTVTFHFYNLPEGGSPSFSRGPFTVT